MENSLKNDIDVNSRSGIQAEKKEITIQIQLIPDPPNGPITLELYLNIPSVAIQKFNNIFPNHSISLTKYQSVEMRRLLNLCIDFMEIDDNLFEILNGCANFYGYEFNDIIPINVVKAINKYINNGFSESIWKELSEKPDYNLELLNKRNWPWISNINKEWKELNMKVKNEIKKVENAENALSGYSSESRNIRT
jgi:hypothetical protein